MSYSIIYKRLFIKMPSGRILPMIQAGDNNVYDINHKGREVRTRSWEVWHLNRENGKPSMTTEEIADWLDAEHKRAQDAYERSIREGYGCASLGFTADKNYGYYRSTAIGGHGTHNTTWGMFKNFFTEGVKKAIPLEEFIRACGPLHVSWYSKEGDSSQYHVYDGKITTEQELDKVWTECIAKATSDGPWVGPAYQFRLDSVANMVHAGTPKKGTRSTTLQITFEDLTTTYLKTVYPFTYTDNKEEAKVFSMAALNDISILRVVPGARSACYESVK